MDARTADQRWDGTGWMKPLEGDNCERVPFVIFCSRVFFSLERIFKEIIAQLPMPWTPFDSSLNVGGWRVGCLAMTGTVFSCVEPSS